MSVSLDLAPVVQLLGPLSTSGADSAPPSPPSQPSAISLASSEPPVSLESSCGAEHRRLGDFSALWSFLASEYATNHGGDTPDSRDDNGEKVSELRPRRTTSATTDITALTTGNQDPPFLYELLGRENGTPKPPTPKVLRRGQKLDDLKAKTTLLQSPKAIKLAEVPVPASFTPHRTTKSKTFENFSSVAPPDSLTKTKPVVKSSTSPEQRKLVLIQKLLNYFPENKSTILNPPRSDSTRQQSSDLHVFVDNSNIAISFIDYIKASRGLKDVNIRRPVLSFHALSLILERGRPTAKRVLVGSAPVTREMIEAKEIGYETSILERVEKDYADNGHRSASSGSETTASKIRRRKVEQGVDEILHMKMFESILDHKPSTIVLASGDGNMAEYSSGFFKAIERCLEKSWRVEIVAFKNSLNSVYRNKEFRKKWKGKFKVIFLDDFAEEMLS